MPRPPFACTGNHAELTPTQLRTHNQHPSCRDELTRKAAADYKNRDNALKRSRRDEAVHLREDAFVLATPSIGSSRRLRSLVYLGYTPKELAELTGLTPNAIWWLLIDPPVRIPLQNHDLIVDAYLARRLQPRPFDIDSELGRAATRARTLATSNGWVSPFSWENIDVDDAPTYRTRRTATA